MASDKAEEPSSRGVEPRNRPPRRHGATPRRREVDGHTFWRTDANGRPVELTTATGIELDGDRCRWTVSPPGARSSREGDPSGGDMVESVSREVRYFLNSVLGAMQRVTHRASVRPAPKPRPTPAPLIPATAPVPCPLCHGEAWPDCEVCDGAGIITARQAEAWRNGTWGRDEDSDH